MPQDSPEIDIEVLFVSPRPEKGEWALRLHTAAARGWLRRYAPGIKVSPYQVGTFAETVEDDVLYLPDKESVILLINVMQDMASGLTISPDPKSLGLIPTPRSSSRHSQPPLPTIRIR